MLFEIFLRCSSLHMIDNLDQDEEEIIRDLDNEALDDTEDKSARYHWTQLCSNYGN